MTSSVAGFTFGNVLPEAAPVELPVDEHPGLGVERCSWRTSPRRHGGRCERWPSVTGTVRYPRIVRIAALDLGTNSFHLLVADVQPDGHFEALAREKAMIRLGDVVSREGRITEAAADVAVATVRRFRLLAEAAGATELHACATSAIRQAANGDDARRPHRAEAGVDGRGDQRAARGRADLRRGPRQRAARARAGAVLRPRRRQRRDHGRRRRRPALGDEREPRRRPAHRRVRRQRPDLEGRPASRSARHLVDVLAPVADDGRRRSNPSWSSAAAARSRTSRTWSPPGAKPTSRCR